MTEVIKGGITVEREQENVKSVEIAPETAQKRVRNIIPRKFLRFKKLYLTRPDLSPTEIAEKCYDVKSRNVARSIASINLRKLNVSRAEIIERMGLTDEVDVSDLIRMRSAKKIQSCNLIVKRDSSGQLIVNENSNDFIEVDDNQTQLKALELTYKIKGAFNEVVGPSDTVNNFLTIIEQINAVAIAGPGKGITIDESQCPNLSTYRDK